MDSLGKRKRQLLSILLCICMIMTGVTVEKKEVRADTSYEVTLLLPALALAKCKVYTGEDMQTEYTFGTEHASGSTVTLYIVPDEHDEILFFEDSTDSVDWSQDNGAIWSHLDEDGNLLYQIEDIDKDHELHFACRAKAYSVFVDEIGENVGLYIKNNCDGTYYEIYGDWPNYTYDENGPDCYIKSDLENSNDKKYKVVVKNTVDSDMETTVFTETVANEDGYYYYWMGRIRGNHHLKFNVEEYGSSSIENNSYGLEYTYKGEVIPEPVKSNFIVKRGMGNGNGDGLTFTWYRGDYGAKEVSESDKLTGAPSDIGTYTLKVDVGEDDVNGYYAGSAKFVVNIKEFVTTAEAVLQGTKNGDWYTGDVTVKAPDGYEISTVQTGGYQDSFTVNQDMDGVIRYYLKEKSTGNLTGAKEIQVRRDDTSPSATITTTDGGGGNWNGFTAWTKYSIFKNNINLSVTASDTLSGLDTAECLLSDTKFTSETAVSGNWQPLKATATGNYSLDVLAAYKGAVYVRVTDKAGNSTIINSDGLVVYRDGQQSTQKVTYTKTTKTDCTAKVILNGNTIQKITIADDSGKTVTQPVLGTDYEVEEETITLAGSYLENLAVGDYTVTVSYYPCGVTDYTPWPAGSGESTPADTTFALSVGRHREA